MTVKPITKKTKHTEGREKQKQGRKEMGSLAEHNAHSSHESQKHHASKLGQVDRKENILKNLITFVAIS